MERCLYLLSLRQQGVLAIETADTDLLRDRPRTTGELCEKFPNLDRCTVMLHLRILEEADLVIVRRQGKFRWNHLNIDPIHGIYRRWIQKYAEPSASLLSKLKSDLED